MCGGFEEHAADAADMRGAETSCEIEVQRLVVLCAVRPVGPFRRFARIRGRVSQPLLSYGLPTTCEVTRPVLRFANSHGDGATGRFFRTNDPMADW
jgi:hypothetical protein